MVLVSEESCGARCPGAEFIGIFLHSRGTSYDHVGAQVAPGASAYQQNHIHPTQRRKRRALHASRSAFLHGKGHERRRPLLAVHPTRQSGVDGCCSAAYSKDASLSSSTHHRSTCSTSSIQPYLCSALSAKATRLHRVRGKLIRSRRRSLRS